MPDKILVDAVTYQVIKTYDRLIVEGQECNATVDYNTATIRISQNADKIGEGNRAKVLMHEVVHAILNERGLNEKAENETLVEELAKGFVNLIRQNPKLIDFIKNFKVEVEGAK